MRYIERVHDDWTTRHPVQAAALRTAALINRLNDGGSVVDVLREHGEAEPIEVSAADVEEMRAAAAKLRKAFAAEDVDAAATALNEILAEGGGQLRLTSHDGRTPWHPHLDRDDDAPWGEWFLASSCLALTVLVWDRQRPPGGVCVSPSCQNVYITQGSGLPQRYCSRRCATRERVAAHRAAKA